MIDDCTYRHSGQISNGYYGVGEGPTWLYQGNCRGNETDVADCPQYSGSGCTISYTDIKVTCMPGITYRINVQNYTR